MQDAKLKKPNEVTYLSADGYLEILDLDYVRPATFEQVVKFKDGCREMGLDPEVLVTDGEYVPYYPVMVNDHAPDHIKKQAENHFKLRRFEDG